MTESESPEALSRRLQEMITNLNREIDARAAALAAPHIAAAQAAAAQAKRDTEESCRREVQRVEDLRTEFQRQLKPATRERDRAEKRARDLEDVLGTAYLHIDWFWVTRQLTTEQKELFAGAVSAWSRRLQEGEEDREPIRPPRWWRDSYNGPFPKNWRH